MGLSSKTLFYALIGLFFLSHTYVFFKHHLGEEKLLRRQISYLEEQLNQEQFRLALKEGELRQFRHMVAQRLPELNLNETKAGDQSYSKRQIASVVSEAQPDLELLNLSELLFTEGQKHFRNRDFGIANKKLSEFVQLNPLSEKTIEAHFLMAEGEYLLGNYDESLKLTETMMRHFPESHLTGFIMLRMGKIYERNNRILEARQVYASVIKNFKDVKLKEQAQAMLNNARL